MRWILGAEDHEGYWMLDNLELMTYIAGSTIGEKYNNIQPRLFREKAGLSEEQFIDLLKHWLI